MPLPVSLQLPHGLLFLSVSSRSSAIWIRSSSFSLTSIRRFSLFYLSQRVSLARLLHPLKIFLPVPPMRALSPRGKVQASSSLPVWTGLSQAAPERPRGFRARRSPQPYFFFIPLSYNSPLSLSSQTRGTPPRRCSIFPQVLLALLGDPTTSSSQRDQQRQKTKSESAKASRMYIVWLPRASQQATFTNTTMQKLPPPCAHLCAADRMHITELTLYRKLVPTTYGFFSVCLFVLFHSRLQPRHLLIQRVSTIASMIQQPRQFTFLTHVYLPASSKLANYFCHHRVDAQSEQQWIKLWTRYWRDVHFSSLYSSFSQTFRHFKFFELIAQSSSIHRQVPMSPSSTCSFRNARYFLKIIINAHGFS